MTEKAADFNEVTEVLAVGLKAGFEWSEQTLADYSENTIMREARVAVVRCDDAADAKGNMSYAYECTNGSNHQVTTLEANDQRHAKRRRAAQGLDAGSNLCWQAGWHPDLGFRDTSR